MSSPESNVKQPQRKSPRLNRRKSSGAALSTASPASASKRRSSSGAAGKEGSAQKAKKRKSVAAEAEESVESVSTSNRRNEDEDVSNATSKAASRRESAKKSSAQKTAKNKRKASDAEVEEDLGRVKEDEQKVATATSNAVSKAKRARKKKSKDGESDDEEEEDKENRRNVKKRGAGRLDRSKVYMSESSLDFFESLVETQIPNAMITTNNRTKAAVQKGLNELSNRISEQLQNLRVPDLAPIVYSALAEENRKLEYSILRSQPAFANLSTRHDQVERELEAEKDYRNTLRQRQEDAIDDYDGVNQARKHHMLSFDAIDDLPHVEARVPYDEKILDEVIPLVDENAIVVQVPSDLNDAIVQNEQLLKLATKATEARTLIDYMKTTR